MKNDIRLDGLRQLWNDAGEWFRKKRQQYLEKTCKKHGHDWIIQHHGNIGITRACARCAAVVTEHWRSAA